MSEALRIVDSHTHLTSPESIKRLVDSSRKNNIDRIAVMSLSCTGESNISQNLHCALAKIMYPGKIFAFGGLIYPESGELTNGQELYEQAVRLKNIGFDGMKMLEGKPDTRKKTGLPLDSPVYDEYYQYLESSGIPVTFHVGDPRIFWDADKAPDWAKKEGWIYTDGSFVSKDALYSEVIGFLSKFPKLKVTFAHFFFMGEENIDKASEFLDRWPGVCYDITPGIEMYGSFSENPEKWREFFIKYQDGIIFGSDNGINEELVHIDTARRFLETDDEFTYKGMKIKGINLEREVLEKIYHGNFERRVGKTPAGINSKLLLEECERVLDYARHLKGPENIMTELKSLYKEIVKAVNGTTSVCHL
ncbi:MAG: amidohydrolase family protein [Clostridiaceae bacterium]|jgi:predicted TIM-barrel fold metal-dependent hydrolase|nr:amidohydrolase family protein [Clostridiaceae bacterium]